MIVATRTTGNVVKVDVTTGGASYLSGATLAGAVVNTAGGVIQNVVVTGAVSASATSVNAATGSGAIISAKTYGGPRRRMSFFQGRFGEVYGVDGMGRGIRIANNTAVPIGIAKPHNKPAITSATTGSGSYVSKIQMVYTGAGYVSTPAVSMGGASTAVRALMDGGAVRDCVLVQKAATTNGGSQYPYSTAVLSAAPDVAIVGGMPSGQSFSVSAIGAVDSVRIIASGTGYTSNETTSPKLVFSTAQGLTLTNAKVIVDDSGEIVDISVLASGTGATTGGVTAMVTGGGGSGAVVEVDMVYRVATVSVVSGGTMHLTPPVITIKPDPSDYSGGGCVATASVSGGVITGVSVSAGGAYSLPPTAVVEDTSAKAVAVLEPPMRGRYLCAIRYLDSTAVSDGGPIPSSISELTEVDVPQGVQSFTWNLSHTQVDARVSNVELWRTTADQAVVLYRVATLDLATTTFIDTLPDPDLLSVTRTGYGMMPITMPSGLVNARRFEVPPANFGVGVMFQDRAWYAVDTTGDNPNSLMYSEVDEPESVPHFNELVIQENAGEHDKIVALVPFGSQLLVVQSGHIYSLTYVAQPVIDAAVALVAYRGVLNEQCWTVMNGVAFLADSYGLYAFDGQSETPLSDVVDNYWRDNIIDFSKASLFHVSSDFSSKVVRFHYCNQTDTAPVRALCYCVSTKAWWEETYPSPIHSSATAIIGGKRSTVFGTTGQSGLARFSGSVDYASSPIPYALRTGDMTLNNDPDRSVGLLYSPLPGDSTVSIGLHFNGSASPRPNAISNDRGGQFVSDAGSTVATLNMNAARSPLGEASGYAQAMFAGRLDPRSVGTDRHIAVGISGNATLPQTKFHAITVGGVG